MELKVHPVPGPQNLSERRFWIGLACVALIHASLLVSLGRSAPRQLGERDGSPEAISVELVDPSALSGASGRPTPSEPAAPAPALAAAPVVPAPAPVGAAQAAPPPPLSEAPASPPAASLTLPSFEEPQTASLAPEASVAPKETAAPEEVTPSRETAAPPGVNPPAPPAAAAPKAALPAQPPVKSKPNPQLSLRLDLPPDFAAPSGLSTAAVRPPDITRSGENDEFGRRVIRALRQTMPPARGELGRVTVRLLLSATGDLSELQLVRAAADPSLTQSVVFAVKQSSFPIPPTGATRSDRTFLVTYIYN
jgi:periplasmic protein TonB